MKICKICRKSLPLYDYYSASSTKDGKNCLCKLCYKLKTNKYSKVKYKEHRLAGLCGKCTQSALPNRVCCEKHTLMGISSDRLGTKKRWKEIKVLLEQQNYICRYSGRPLRLGDNASVDHIIPVSKGGTNEVDNLCWVDITVNKMKMDLDLNEFLDLVSEIYSKSLTYL